MFVSPPSRLWQGTACRVFFDWFVKENGDGVVVKQAVLLLKVGVGYRWFETALQWHVCFLTGRLAFIQPITQQADTPAGQSRCGAWVQNAQGCSIVYMGPGVAKFACVFG